MNYEGMFTFIAAYNGILFLSLSFVKGMGINVPTRLIVSNGILTLVFGALAAGLIK